MKLRYTGNTWGWDQAIISRILLKTGLCTAPRHLKIWRLSSLDPPDKDDERSDNATCFHGMEKWEDCTAKKGPLDHPLGKCSRWHFYPTQREKDLLDKYEEIVTLA